MTSNLSDQQVQQDIATVAQRVALTLEPLRHHPAEVLALGALEAVLACRDDDVAERVLEVLLRIVEHFGRGQEGCK